MPTRMALTLPLRLPAEFRQFVEDALDRAEGLIRETGLKLE